MIFKTFDSKIDKWTSKIGIFGKSFNELGTVVNEAFKSAIDNLDNFDENVGFWESLKNNLFFKQADKDWIKNSFGDIISKENIDSYIAELDLDSAKEKLQGIFDWQEDVKNNDKSWQDYFGTLDDGEKYIVDLIKNTDDLSKLTGEDLVKANQQARASALAHNEAIKAQTFSAKAGKVALQALATVGNMFIGWAITKVIELTVKALDNWIHRVEKANEATEEAINIFKSISSEVESLENKISDLNDQIGQLDPITDEEDINNLKLETEELNRQLAILEEKQRIAGDDADKAAQKSLGMTEPSRYKTSERESAYGGTEVGASYVTKDEELLNAIEAYERYSQVVEDANNSLVQMAESGEYSRKEWNEQEKIVSMYTERMADARSHANELAVALSEQKEGLNGTTESSKELLDTIDGAISKYDEWLDQINGVTDALNAQAGSTEDVTVTADVSFDITAHKEQIDNAQSSISTLLSALNSLSSGQLTENEIIDLVQQFPDLAPYIDLAADGFGNLSEGLRTLIAQQPEPLIADLESLKSSLSTDEERRKVDLLIGSLRELGGVGSWFTTSDDLFGSFQSVIDSVSKDDPFKEIGQSLLDLAEQGRLTVDTFHETDSIGYFESLGISADEAVARINRLVDESRQLSSMSDQISKMADALGTKRENGFVEDDTLAGFDVEVRGLESWDRFQETLGSTASSYEECREAASALATEWVNSGDFLAQLTEQNREYYATQLEAMGVENYEEVISYAQALNEAKEALSQSSLGLGQATQDEIEALIAEGTYSGLAADMILALYDAKIAEMAATIDTSTDCANLIALAGDTDATSQSIQLLIQLMDIYSGLESGVYDGNASLREEASKKAAEIKSQLEEIANRENNAVTIEPKIKLGSRGKSSARSAGKAAGKSVKDGMKEELSNMNSVISYIGNIIGKQISKLNDQKEAAIDALEAQKKAAEEALEAEKKAIQEKIDAKQDEIDAIEEAAKARKNEIDLQKAQYELERMQSQRTKLVNYVPDAIVI